MFQFNNVLKAIAAAASFVGMLSVSPAFADDYSQPDTSSSSPSFLGGTVFESTMSAGSTTVDSTTYAQPIGQDVYLGINSTTTYTMPSYGSDGPINGTYGGSSSSTSYGAGIVIEY